MPMVCKFRTAHIDTRVLHDSPGLLQMLASGYELFSAKYSK